MFSFIWHEYNGKFGVRICVIRFVVWTLIDTAIGPVNCTEKRIIIDIIHGLGHFAIIFVKIASGISSGVKVPAQLDCQEQLFSIIRYQKLF
jgi:hypothetical protein